MEKPILSGGIYINPRKLEIEGADRYIGANHKFVVEETDKTILLHIAYLDQSKRHFLVTEILKQTRENLLARCGGRDMILAKHPLDNEPDIEGIIGGGSIFTKDEILYFADYSDEFGAVRHDILRRIVIALFPTLTMYLNREGIRVENCVVNSGEDSKKDLEVYER